MKAYYQFKQTILEYRDYSSLNTSLSVILIKLYKCTEPKNWHLLIETLSDLKLFLDSVDGKHTEVLRRPLEVLNTVLVSRLVKNANLNTIISQTRPNYQGFSVNYDPEFQERIAYASSEEELRNLNNQLIDSLVKLFTQEA